MTPREYVAWADKRAKELGLEFRARPEQIDEMIRSGTSHSGDLFLDYDEQGHLYSRPGLEALLQRVEQDKSVSHVLIPRRDRLARPDVIAEALTLENKFLQNGVSLVFMSGLVQAPRRGQRMGVEHSIMAVIEYENAGNSDAISRRK